MQILRFVSCMNLCHSLPTGVFRRLDRLVFIIIDAAVNHHRANTDGSLVFHQRFDQVVCAIFQQKQHKDPNRGNATRSGVNPYFWSLSCVTRHYQHATFIHTKSCVVSGRTGIVA
jgi:hypothetical protein